jgi:hypothetical protein
LDVSNIGSSPGGDPFNHQDQPILVPDSGTPFALLGGALADLRFLLQESEKVGSVSTSLGQVQSFEAGETVFS